MRDDQNGTCKHTTVRYVLDGSETSKRQQDGVDELGRPYRDVPMKPTAVFNYAKMIGSTFESRVLSAACVDCREDIQLP